jgi:membrane fusion protein (multidrug efflux system)
MSMARTVALSVVALAVLLLLIGFMAGIFNDRIEPGRATLAPAGGGAAWIVTGTTLTATEAVPASVEARETTIVAARLLGRVDSISVRAGDYVEAGQVLVRLEQAELEARAGQAEEGVRSVRARLTEARQNLARAEELRERQLIAQADLDAAQANALALEADLAAAQQSLSGRRRPPCRTRRSARRWRDASSIASPSPAIRCHRGRRSCRFTTRSPCASRPGCASPWP